MPEFKNITEEEAIRMSQDLCVDESFEERGEEQYKTHEVEDLIRAAVEDGWKSCKAFFGI